MSDPGPTVFNGRYELHRRLGRGGMAEVFLARDQLLDRPVAVKVLFPEFATDPAFVERFRREATAAANLNHPNIVGVYDWGEADGTYFIVMEYVDGRTLSEILRAEGPLHPDRAADVGADVAAALGFAHRNGVVHRDVKPGNVLVTAAGQVKVADFGIARAITANADENLTQVGTVMGTATYFSPEQARGDAVDPRSDIYSLGCVLYELLRRHARRSAATRRWRSPTSTCRSRRSRRASSTPSCPPPSRRSSSSAWPRTRSNRYPSAEDLRADLRRFREGSGILAEPVMAPPVDPGATSVVAATAAGRGGRRRAPYYDEDDDEPKRSSRLFLVGLIVLLVAAGRDAVPARPAVRRRRRRPRPPRSRCPTSSASRSAEAQAHPRGRGLRGGDHPGGERGPGGGQRLRPGPRVGEKVDEGSTVQLKVSAGAEADPRARRRSAPRSSRRASCSPAQGFTVKEEQVVDEEAPVGEVVDQDPGPNEEAPRGSEVTLFVSKGPADRPVPDVVGKTIAEASNLLGQAGFTVNQTSEASDTVEEGRVIRTDPPADTVRPKGTAVTVVVSSGPAESTVPSVVGLTEANAINILDGDGFPARRRGGHHRRPHRGRPRASTRTPTATPPPPDGSTVTIVVGRATSAADRRRSTAASAAPARRADLGEEVAQQVVAADGEDRLGVELHALHRQLAVAQAHHHAVVGLGGDLEAVGHRRPVDHEAVVAGGLERLRQPGEHAGVGVADERRLAVHHLRRPHHLAAVHLADALVAEAHAEHRHPPGEGGDHVVRHAGVVGRARARARSARRRARAPRARRW